MNISETFNKALELFNKGRFGESLEICKKILLFEPDNPDALHLAGIIYYNYGQYKISLQYFIKASEINPSNPCIYYNTGNIYKDTERFEEALSFYKKAIEIQNDFFAAYYNSAIVYQELKKFDEAISFYKRAIELQPDFADSYYNMSLCYIAKGQTETAMKFLIKAAELNPDYAEEIFNNIKSSFTGANSSDRLFSWCMSHLLTIYENEQNIELSRLRYSEELNNLINTVSLNDESQLKKLSEAIGYNKPFYLASHGKNNRNLQEKYGNFICKVMSLRYPEFSKSPEIDVFEKPIRVGIVSGFFREHSVWKIPTRGWLEGFDCNKIVLYGYHTGNKEDKITSYAKNFFHKFTEKSESFEEMCMSIKNDKLHAIIFPEIGIDPLVIKLACLRLAPVQCVSLGHPDTTGLPTIDYYLSSELMEPDNGEEHYSEKLIRLPNLGFSYLPVEINNIDIDRSKFGLDNESIIYLCTHSWFTHLPQYDYIYPAIASNLEKKCKFIFISSPLSQWITEQFKSRIGKSFEKYGLDPEKYTVFLPYLNKEQYYGLNKIADVFLDTPAWSANNSTFEALGADLPVITMPGNLMRQRHCYGILKMMEMTETIVYSLDEYIKLAVKLGKDKDYRKKLSEEIKEKKHLLYKDEKCIRALENFLEQALFIQP